MGQRVTRFFPNGWFKEFVRETLSRISIVSPTHELLYYVNILFLSNYAQETTFDEQSQTFRRNNKNDSILI